MTLLQMQLQRLHHWVTHLLLLPPTYLGVPAGTYFFFNAGAGDYTVDVTEVGICNPINNPDAITVTVPDGMDMVEATWYLGDVLGNVIADNDPNTVPGTAANLGVVTIPEGSCSYQQQLYAFGIDNCDGLIIALNAASAVASGYFPTTFLVHRSMLYLMVWVSTWLISTGLLVLLRLPSREWMPQVI
jgi:hypothetical protein